MKYFVSIRRHYTVEAASEENALMAAFEAEAEIDAPRELGEPDIEVTPA